MAVAGLAVAGLAVVDLAVADPEQPHKSPSAPGPFSQGLQQQPPVGTAAAPRAVCVHVCIMHYA
jgi:hypothetical protein